MSYEDLMPYAQEGVVSSTSYSVMYCTSIMEENGLFQAESEHNLCLCVDPPYAPFLVVTETAAAFVQGSQAQAVIAAPACSSDDQKQAIR